MKLFYCAIFVFVFPKCKSQTVETSKLEKFLYDRCYKYSSNAANYDKFKNHIQDFSSYAQYTSNLLPVDKQQFCLTERSKLLQSAKQILQDLKPCLPQEEKYLPEFLSESFAQFFDFLCEHKGRNIDSFFSSQGKNCRTVLEQQNASLQVDNCFSKIFAPLRGFIKKDDLCEDFDVAKKCFSVVLQTHCSNFVAYEKLNRDFFDSIRKPCSSCAVLFFYSNFHILIIAYLLKILL